LALATGGQLDMQVSLGGLNIFAGHWTQGGYCFKHHSKLELSQKPMKVDWDAEESTPSILIGFAALLGFELFFFTLVVPIGSVMSSRGFWASFSVWAALGLGLLMRNVKGRRKARQAMLAFAILLFVALLLGAISKSNLLWEGFAGFYAGIGIYAIIVLISRATKKPVHRPRE